MTTAVANLTEADVAALDAIVDQWCTACLSRDWDALLELCTEDCTFLPPGSPAVPAAGLRAYLEAYPVITKMSYHYDLVDGREDVAGLSGGLAMAIETEDGVQEFTGKFVDLARKGDDGTWRYSVVIWNTDA